MPYVADVSLLVILLSKLFMSQQHTLRAAIKQNYKIMHLMTKKEDMKKRKAGNSFRENDNWKDKDKD